MGTLSYSDMSIFSDFIYSLKSTKAYEKGFETTFFENVTSQICLARILNPCLRLYPNSELPFPQAFKEITLSA